MPSASWWTATVPHVLDDRSAERTYDEAWATSPCSCCSSRGAPSPSPRRGHLPSPPRPSACPPAAAQRRPSGRGRNGGAERHRRPALHPHQPHPHLPAMWWWRRTSRSSAYPNADGQGHGGSSARASPVRSWRRTRTRWSKYIGASHDTSTPSWCSTARGSMRWPRATPLRRTSPTRRAAAICCSP